MSPNAQSPAALQQEPLHLELLQHLYSSVTLLRTVGMSPGLPAATRRELEAIPDYELPPGVVPDRKLDPSTVPEVFRFFELQAPPGAGRCFALCRSGYVGLDRSKRTGNYVNHTVLLPVDVLDAVRWDLPGLMKAVTWQRDRLEEEPGQLPLQRVSLARGWITSSIAAAMDDLGESVYATTLDAVLEAHARDVPIYLCGLPPARALALLRGIWQALPVAHRANTSFVTYAPKDDARLLNHGRRPLRLVLMDPRTRPRAWVHRETLARVGELEVQAAERFITVTFPGMAAQEEPASDQWAPRVFCAPPPPPPATSVKVGALVRWTVPAAREGDGALERWLSFAAPRRLAPKPRATEALLAWWQTGGSQEAEPILRRAEALVPWCGDEVGRAWLRDDLAGHLGRLPPSPESLPLLELWGELLAGSAAGFEQFSGVAVELLGTLLKRDAPHARVLEAVGRCGPVAARHAPLMDRLWRLLLDACPRVEHATPADHQSLADTCAALASGLDGMSRRQRALDDMLEHLWSGRCRCLFVALLLQDPVAWRAMEARHGLHRLLQLSAKDLERLVDGLWRRLLLTGPVGMTASLHGVRFQGARGDGAAPEAPSESGEERLARLLCEAMVAGHPSQQRVVARALFRAPPGRLDSHRRLLAAAGRIWQMHLHRPLEAFPHPHLQLELLDELGGAPPTLKDFSWCVEAMPSQDLRCFYHGLRAVLRQASEPGQLRLMYTVWNRLQLDPGPEGQGCYRWLLGQARTALLPATLGRSRRVFSQLTGPNGDPEPLMIWTEICKAAATSPGRVDALFQAALRELLEGLSTRAIITLGRLVRDGYPGGFDAMLPCWCRHLDTLPPRRRGIFGSATVATLFLR